MPEPVRMHRLMNPTGAVDLTGWTVVCGARNAQHATWDATLVTCPACTGARAPCTCGPGVPLCPACRAWNAAHRGRPTILDRGPGQALPALRTEKQFQEAVRQLALQQGWLYYHTQDARKSPPGFPDLACVRGPTLLLAELKMPGKVPTAAQQAWLEALGQVTHVETHLWRPSDLESIVEKLF